MLIPWRIVGVSQHLSNNKSPTLFCLLQEPSQKYEHHSGHDNIDFCTTIEIHQTIPSNLIQMSTRIEATWAFQRHNNPEKSHLQYIKRNTNTHFFFWKTCLESELVAKIAKNPSKDFKGPWGKINRFHLFWPKMLRNHSWHPRSCTCNMRGSCQLAVRRIWSYSTYPYTFRSHSNCSTKNRFEEQSRTVPNN